MVLMAQGLRMTGVFLGSDDVVKMLSDVDCTWQKDIIEAVRLSVKISVKIFIRYNASQELGVSSVNMGSEKLRLCSGQGINDTRGF